MKKILKNQTFFDNIFDSAIALLLIIAVFLIYTMSLSNIEEKINELSIFRTLGLKKNSVFFILFFKGLLYSIPGLITGLLISYYLKFLI